MEVMYLVSCETIHRFPQFENDWLMRSIKVIFLVSHFEELTCQHKCTRVYSLYLGMIYSAVLQIKTYSLLFSSQV